jgi:hypothetical protein
MQEFKTNLLKEIQANQSLKYDLATPQQLVNSI